ncbi:MAG: hypothetical protein ACRYFB_00080 [Janthinobacterium lividum]
MKNFDHYQDMILEYDEGRTYVTEQGKHSVNKPRSIKGTFLWNLILLTQ